MKTQQKVTNLKKLGYNFISIVDMIKGLETLEVYNKLRMVQQDEFDRIKKRYSKLRYLTEQYRSYLYQLYYNFVLNGFTYEDKNKEFVQVNQPQHIGLQMLNKLN